MTSVSLQEPKSCLKLLQAEATRDQVSAWMNEYQISTEARSRPSSSLFGAVLFLPCCPLPVCPIPYTHRCTCDQHSAFVKSLIFCLSVSHGFSGQWPSHLYTQHLAWVLTSNRCSVRCWMSEWTHHLQSIKLTLKFFYLLPNQTKTTALRQCLKSVHGFPLRVLRTELYSDE